MLGWLHHEFIEKRLIEKVLARNGPAKPLKINFTPTFQVAADATASAFGADELELLKSHATTLQRQSEARSTFEGIFEREPDSVATINAKKRRAFDALTRHRWVALERRAARELREKYAAWQFDAMRVGGRTSYREGFTTFNDAFDGESLVVRACNLTRAEAGDRAAALNGVLGMLGSLDMRSGRYELSLVTGEQLWVRPQNVEKVQVSASTSSAASSSGNGSRQLLSRDTLERCRQLQAKLEAGVVFADLPEPDAQSRKELLHDLRRARQDWPLPLDDVSLQAQKVLFEPDVFPGRSFAAGQTLHARRQRMEHEDEDPAPKSEATKSAPQARAKKLPSPRNDDDSFVKVRRRVEQREAIRAQYAAQTSSVASVFGNFNLTTNAEKRLRAIPGTQPLLRSYNQRGRTWDHLDKSHDKTKSHATQKPSIITPRQSIFNPFLMPRDVAAGAAHRESERWTALAA